MGTVYSEAAKIRTGFRSGSVGPVDIRNTVYDPSKESFRQMLDNYSEVGKEDFVGKYVCTGETKGEYGEPIFERVAIMVRGRVTFIDSLGRVERAVNRKKAKRKQK